MFNNITPQANTSSEQGKGVFNQFVAPIASEGFTPKRDTVKVFLMTTLFIVILLAIGAFLYLKVLAQEVESKEAQLKAFDSTPTLTQFEGQLPDMRILSQRLKLLNSVYDSRIYISQMLFPILESTVESSGDSSVYFNRFSLKKQINSNLASLSLGGMALDYPTLYRQLNNFKSGQYSEFIKNFNLGGFSLNERRTVEFDITFDIDVSTNAFLKYLSILNPNFQADNFNTTRSGPLYNIAPTPRDVASSSTTTTSGNGDEDLSSQVLLSNPEANSNASNQSSSNSDQSSSPSDDPAIITSDQ